MFPQLTAGAIQRIASGEMLSNVVVQILGYKKVSANNTADRFRLHIFDGVTNSTLTMLGTQLNQMIYDKQLEKFTIIQIDKYVCNNHGEKKIVIFLSLTVLASGSEVGMKLENQNGTNQVSSDNEINNVTVKKETTTDSNSANQMEYPFNGGFKNKPSYNSYEPNSSMQNNEVMNIHPINSLTPYQNKWTIKARVTSKPPIRFWNNSKGEGKLFSITLLDESGEIRATGFNDSVDKFYELVEVNKVYYISKGILKTANKNFSSVKNDYEITFNNETTIVPCDDNSTSIPQLQFNFISISQIESVDKDVVVDVIGICKSASEATTITARTTGKEFVKRDIKLVDDKNVDIRLTIWGTDAEKFDPSQNPVVAVKGARVSDFGGKSLTLISNSVMQINPDIKDAHKLKGWFDREGCKMESTSLSGGGGPNSEGKWKNFAQVTSEKLGMGDKADFFTNKATVALVRKENCMYMACPSEGCNKKVIDLNNGNYRCEKCAKEYSNFKWRLLMSMSIADFTGNQWVNCFSDAGETILGVTADELGSIKESDEDRFNDIIADANFKSFIFNMRIKMEVYNEESRLKIGVASATPIDNVTYGKKLLKEIKAM